MQLIFSTSCPYNVSMPMSMSPTMSPCHPFSDPCPVADFLWLNLLSTRFPRPPPPCGYPCLALSLLLPHNRSLIAWLLLSFPTSSSFKIKNLYHNMLNRTLPSDLRWHIWARISRLRQLLPRDQLAGYSESTRCFHHIYSWTEPPFET